MRFCYLQALECGTLSQIKYCVSFKPVLQPYRDTCGIVATACYLQLATCAKGKVQLLLPNWHSDRQLQFAVATKKGKRKTKAKIRALFSTAIQLVTHMPQIEAARWAVLPESTVLCHEYEYE